jgi:hypothetical protein
VTFRIPEEMGNSAKSAYVVGEFNNWTFFSTPMKKLNRIIFGFCLVLVGMASQMSRTKP